MFGVVKGMLVDDPYGLGKKFGASDWIMSMEGTKGGDMLEWKSSDFLGYNAIEALVRLVTLLDVPKMPLSIERR